MLTMQFAAFKRDHSKGGKLGGDHYDLTTTKKSKKSKKSCKGGKRGGGFITLGPGENINDFL